MVKDSIRTGNYVIKVSPLTRENGAYYRFHSECDAKVYLVNANAKSATQLGGLEFRLSSLPSDNADVVILHNFNANKLGQRSTADASMIETLVYEAILTMYAGEKRIITQQDWFDIGNMNNTGSAAAGWFAKRFGLQRGIHGIAVIRAGPAHL